MLFIQWVYNEGIKTDSASLTELPVTLRDLGLVADRTAQQKLWVCVFNVSDSFSRPFYFVPKAETVLCCHTGEWNYQRHCNFLKLSYQKSARLSDSQSYIASLRWIPEACASLHRGRSCTHLWLAVVIEAFRFVILMDDLLIFLHQY